MLRHPTWGIFEGPIIHSNDGINQWRSHRARCSSRLLSYFRRTTSRCTEGSRVFDEQASCVIIAFIHLVSWINFLHCHRSEALQLQSATNGYDFVSLLAATDTRKWKTGSETIKYTYRAERLPGYRGGKLRRWGMLELVHAVMRLQSSEVGLRAEHIPRLPGRCCDIKASSTQQWLFQLSETICGPFILKIPEVRAMTFSGVHSVTL